MELKLAYICLSILMTVIIILIGLKTINKTFSDRSIAKKKKLILILPLLLWHLYIFAITSTGILENYDFPPRFVLFLIFPAFLFTGVFIYKNRNNLWVRNVPQSWIIYYQSFRVLIEIIFVFSVAKGVLHYHVTIEGYNYDMLFAFSAPIIAFLVFQKRFLPKKVAIWWNYIGLCVIAFIIFLFQTTLYFPELYGSNTILLPPEFVMYPYILVGGFLMPSAVFMHVLSIVQLSRNPVTNME